MNKWKLLPVMMVLWLLLLFGFTSHAAETSTGEYYGMTLAEWDKYVKTVQSNLNNQTWDLYSMMPYYFVTQFDESHAVIFYSDCPLRLYSAFPYLSYNGIFARAIIAFDDSGPHLYGTGGNYHTSGVTSYQVYNESWLRTDIFLANHDIYDLSSNSVFFQQTPKAYLTESVLVPVLIALPLREMTLKEVVGLLPLLMLFVVSVISFWKGWRFLLRVLRTL